MNISNCQCCGFFLPPLFLFLPLPHILSFVFILGKVVCGGKQSLFCWKRELIRLVKKAHYWFCYVYSGLFLEECKVEVAQIYSLTWETWESASHLQKWFFAHKAHWRPNWLLLLNCSGVAVLCLANLKQCYLKRWACDCKWQESLDDGCCR